MNKSVFYIAPATFSFERIREDLSAFYALDAGKKDKETFTLFDTFDWRLWKKGLRLQKTSSELLLTSPDRESIRTEHRELAENLTLNLIPPEIRKQIKSIAGIRALLPQVKYTQTDQSFTLRDKRRKAIARIGLFVRTTRAKSGKRIRQLGLSNSIVRGYDKQNQPLINWLNSEGFVAAKKDGLNELFISAGFSPATYSSKPDYPLTAEMRADEAVKHILSRLLDTMTMNTQGIIDDIDTEFLHDFRVSVRRSRSAIGQLKNVFPARTTTRAKRDYSQLGKLTNELRDIDVYLLEEQHYRSLLPKNMRSNLDLFFAQLRMERGAEHEKIKTYLESNNFSTFVSYWKKYFNSPCPAHPTAKNAAIPVTSFAARSIKKQFRRVINEGRKITDVSADERLHELRILCKKLRYLLEFFQSLFPKKQMSELISHLKTLQDNLGNFNDFCVQQDKLHAFISGHTTLNAPEMVMAIGYLISELKRKQVATRAEFYAAFAQFDSDDVHAAMTNINKGLANI